jgi:hypothetical protein
VRGAGTPAPLAPTKFLVVTALHRYVRNPDVRWRFSRADRRGCTVSCIRAPRLCRFLLRAGRAVRWILPGAHFAPPVRRVVRGIPQDGPALDPQIQTDPKLTLRSRSLPLSTPPAPSSPGTDRLVAAEWRLPESAGKPRMCPSRLRGGRGHRVRRKVGRRCGRRSRLHSPN